MNSNNSQKQTMPIAETSPETKSLHDLNHDCPHDSLNSPEIKTPPERIDPPPPALIVEPAPVPEPLPRATEQFELEDRPAKRSSLATTKRRLKGLATSMARTGRSLCPGCGGCSLALLIIVLCLLPDGMYVLYAYYFSYAEVYFNSKVSINIFRNNNTENAFKVFYWFLCILCVIPNGIAGWGIMYLGWVCSEGVNGCLRFMWMIPWFAIFLAMKSITLWIRPTVTPVWQSTVFNSGCNLSDYSAILASSSFNNFEQNLPEIGTANITFNSVSGTNYSMTLTRNEANHKIFDFQVTSTSGNDNPLFLLITYDTQNQNYTAVRAVTGTKNVTAANITGPYSISPLSFPQFNMTTLDSDIPFTRPDYGGCWPAAASLVIRNNNTASYINVLNSLTLDPNDNTRLRVCGTAGDVAGEFQISLGVVFIEHYLYAMCTTAPNSNGEIGDDCDPDGNCNDNSD